MPCMHRLVPFRWKVAIVQSPPIQTVLRSRIRAGMSRFSKTMRREWSEAALEIERASAPSGTVT
eukprot:scaffold107081_cov46-Tisochrysis_lutea.AAC.2